MGHDNVWNSRKGAQTHGRAGEKGELHFISGRGGRTCRVCQNGHGIIRKYGLDICRQCFRERAANIGFEKFS